MNNVVECLASNLNSRTEFNRFQLNPTALIRTDLDESQSALLSDIVLSSSS